MRATQCVRAALSEGDGSKRRARHMSEWGGRGGGVRGEVIMWRGTARVRTRL